MAQDIEWTTSSYFQSSLTFDLMTSKSIEVIYTLQGTSVPKLVSVRQKVLMIWLSNIIRTLFCQYLLCPEQFDLWPFNDNKVIHFSCNEYLCTIYAICQAKVLKVMAPSLPHLIYQLIFIVVWPLTFELSKS